MRKKPTIPAGSGSGTGFALESLGFTFATGKGKGAMDTRLGPIEIVCDAPPSPVVEGCYLIGIQDPEDVRWLRFEHYMNERYGRRGLFSLSRWVKWFRAGEPERPTCTCGSRLPELEKFAFQFSLEEQETYLIGQCSRCRTVFWDPADDRESDD
jgi:hypothetical protein